MPKIKPVSLNVLSKAEREAQMFHLGIKTGRKEIIEALVSLLDIDRRIDEAIEQRIHDKG